MSDGQRDSATHKKCRVCGSESCLGSLGPLTQAAVHGNSEEPEEISLTEVLRRKDERTNSHRSP